MRRRSEIAFLAVFLLAIAAAQLRQPAAFAQQEPAAADSTGGFGFGGDFVDKEKEIVLFASFTAPQDQQPARLFVTAKLAPQWHLYSITQPAGAVKPTSIKLDPSDQCQLLGKFVPDRAPKRRETEVFDVPLEEHYDAVTFSAPIQLADGVDLAQLQIGGELDGMICHDERGCLPLTQVDTRFVAELANGRDARQLLAMVPDEGSGSQSTGVRAMLSDRATPPAGEGPVAAGEEAGYRAAATHAVIHGYVEPQVVRPGMTATLVLTATPDPPWYVYAYAERSVPDDISNPTRIVLQRPDGWRLQPPTASASIVEKQVEGFPVVRYHEGTVTWTAEVRVPAEAKLGEYTLEGLIGYQTCSNQCDRPVAASFSAPVQVAADAVPGKVPLSIGDASESYRSVAELADAAAEQLVVGDFDAKSVQTEELVEATSIGWALLFAFGGGLILNIMPCVLPVIGLKVLSFFEQAGQSRARAFWLNVWYSLGLLSVFLVLAFLGVGLSGLFTARLFGIIMASVVFAMALSLMGLWELQVPGFLGTGKAQELTQKEGVMGAFFKGVITTLLAIPCGAPLLSPALKWADEQVRAGAPQNVYLAFAVIGLGMASPYLIIGAFPEMLRFLPKPGAWMETFKKAMGYLLLVAVVWILYFLPLVDVVPAVALLFGIWLACWLVGRIPVTAPGWTYLLTWSSAAIIVAVTYAVSFHLLLRPAMEEKIERLVVAHAAPSDAAELLWQPFERSRFEQLVADRKTVMVDFTADWCLTCKTLEATVLKTVETAEAVQRNGVITLLADWTDGNPEVTAMLDILGSRQVPVLAIFPAGDANRPIVLRGWYDRQTLLDAIERAGPSMNAVQDNRTAMQIP
jgi:thiol:disulfide interchange protein